MAAARYTSNLVLVSFGGRFKAIDKFRRDARFDTLDEVPEQHDALITYSEDKQNESLEDDQLPVDFHVLSPLSVSEAQVALTLREICGLTTRKLLVLSW